MNTFLLKHVIRILPLCLLATVAAQAQPAASEAPLPAWEQLSVQQREQLTAAIRERWDGSSPEERTRMLARAERWQQMAPQMRERARHGVNRLQDLTPEQRRELRALYHHLATLPESGRDALRAQWQAMTPEQRRAWAESHPPPPRHSRSPSRGSMHHPSPQQDGPSPPEGTPSANEP